MIAAQGRLVLAMQDQATSAAIASSTDLPIISSTTSSDSLQMKDSPDEAIRSKVRHPITIVAAISTGTTARPKGLVAEKLLA